MTTPTTTPTRVKTAQVRSSSLKCDSEVLQRIPALSEPERSRFLCLGVKWSQVQILSARQQVRSGFRSPEGRFFCVTTPHFYPNQLFGGTEKCLLERPFLGD